MISCLNIAFDSIALSIIIQVILATKKISYGQRSPPGHSYTIANREQMDGCRLEKLEIVVPLNTQTAVLFLFLLISYFRPPGTAVRIDSNTLSHTHTHTHPSPSETGGNTLPVRLQYVPQHTYIHITGYYLCGDST